jgi:hypothetical protein
VRLAELHARLIDLLAADAPLDSIAPELASNTDDPATRAWLASFTPPMLATARELVRRWGRRAD